ncbi:kielin/chordin-like protein [Stegodyphus dumicola]|uniref:kielin/chordin-like protein n=1 Tax=Stegodyphus dumicola TaxID=202533 RepID=UPI0015B1CCD5|nr:kielin/chordin-like protein [Stegodyphus dumicola]XP_035223208.1 kielin/chordin-like protein [Stegodyphus dumicola]XP_035223209.1 kielin/chordin-like protein [Stegodyphus dumicola]
MDRHSCIWIFAFLRISCVFAGSCEWRYYEHYKQKRCEPILGEQGCPIRFECPPLSDETNKTCFHNGKSYNDEEVIKDAGPCASCSCVVDSVNGGYIACWPVDCPMLETRKKHCYMGYKPGSCCPEEICHKTCEHNGITYELGEIIKTKDPCQRCICTIKWEGEYGYGCEKTKCLNGINAYKIRKGCLPIYEEDVCCMIDMHCDGIHGAEPVAFPKSNTDDLCRYRGRYYKRGSTAYLTEDLFKQIECRCEVPPDFKCIKKSSKME